MKVCIRLNSEAVHLDWASRSSMSRMYVMASSQARSSVSSSSWYLRICFMDSPFASASVPLGQEPDEEQDHQAHQDPPYDPVAPVTGEPVKETIQAIHCGILPLIPQNSQYSGMLSSFLTARWPCSIQRFKGSPRERLELREI